MVHRLASAFDRGERVRLGASYGFILLIHVVGWGHSPKETYKAALAEMAPGMHGITIDPAHAAVVNRLPVKQYAVGSAVNQAIRQVGSVLGVALIVMLAGRAGTVRGDFARPYELQIALSLLTAHT